MTGELTIRAEGSGAAPEARDGHLVLAAERGWVVTGPPAEVAAVADAAGRWARRYGDACLLKFGNSVGRYVLAGLGPVELESGKLGAGDFDAMLAELTEEAAALPFAGGTGAGLPWARVHAGDPDVLLHAFVYLRYVTLGAAPLGDRLVPALRHVVARPHHRHAPSERDVPVEVARSVGTRGLLRIVRSPWTWAPSHSVAALATALHGHLPTEVREDHRRRTFDTPENRFVLSFLRLARAVVDQVRREAARGRDDLFSRGLLADCDAIDAALEPIVRHALWTEVGPLVHFPAGSTVLQRRHGYREVLRHFVRLRLVSRIPLDARAADDLLRLKDISRLYELWCFFAVARAVTSRRGPPEAAERVTYDAMQASVSEGLCVTWPDGTRLHYNRRFTGRGRGDYRTTSVNLRPDIALEVPHGPAPGLHLFDAKFRLERLGPADDDDGTPAAEAKKADLYKMHAYRDAIPEARSATALYPGTEAVFYPAAVGGEWDGVGAWPLRPGSGGTPPSGEQLLGELLL